MYAQLFKKFYQKNSCRCCGPPLDICYSSLNDNINILNRNSPDASSEHHIPLFRQNYLQAIHWFLWWCDLYLWLHCFSCSRGCQQQVLARGTSVEECMQARCLASVPSMIAWYLWVGTIRCGWGLRPPGLFLKRPAWRVNHATSPAVPPRRT